jgi:VWFA-related protein
MEDAFRGDLPMKGSHVVPLSLLAACVAAPLPAQLTAGQSFGERVEVNVVNVEVQVTDKSGAPVTGLQRGDFTVLEDGKPMEIVNFEPVSRSSAPGAPPPGAPAAPVPAGGPAAPQAAGPDASQEPALWVVYIDNFDIKPGSRNRVLRQLASWLPRQLAPGDRVMVATDDLGLHIRLPFTADREALARALEGVEKVAARGGELDSARRTALEQILSIQDLGTRGPGQVEFEPCPREIADPAKIYAAEVRQHSLNSIGALKVLVNSLSGMPGRKVLLHVSDGIPQTPGEELFQVLYEICGGGAATSGIQNSGFKPYDTTGASSVVYKATQGALDAQEFSTTRYWTSLAASANAEGVTFYMFQAEGAGASGTPADSAPQDRLLTFNSVASIESTNRQQTLSLLASETGGRAVFWANDLTPDLARIQEDLGSYYSLGIGPSHSGDGKEHRLEVRVRRPGVTVRHRRSYRDKPPLERTFDRTLASLYHGYEDNPLDLQVEIGTSTPAKAGTFTVPVRLRIPLFRLGLQTRPDAFEGRLRLLVASRSAMSTTPMRQIEVPISIPHNAALIALGKSYLYELTLTLGAGEQHIAVAVRDEATGTTSYLARSVEVGAQTAARAASPVL